MGLVPTLPGHLGIQYHIRSSSGRKARSQGHDLSCAGGHGGLLLSLCFQIVLPIYGGQGEGERVAGGFSCQLAEGWG